MWNARQSWPHIFLLVATSSMNSDQLGFLLSSRLYQRCGAANVFEVGGTNLDAIDFYYCKECIRVLHSFRQLYFKVRFSQSLLLERGNERLEAWLEPKGQVIQ